MKKLFVILGMAVAADAFACADHELQDPSAAVQVVNASVNTTKTDGPLVVTVIGELKNVTSNKIDSLVIEAKVTDASGKVVDVLTESMYGLVAPAGQQVAFRLQGQAATSAASYAGVQVRVVNGESHSPSGTRSGATQWKELAMSWGPMVLLVLVWIFLARKHSGKGSHQDKMLSAVVEQNALLTRQSAAIETMAAVLSSRKTPGEG
jgi:ATP-dependent Zn protease